MDGKGKEIHARPTPDEYTAIKLFNVYAAPIICSTRQLCGVEPNHGRHPSAQLNEAQAGNFLDLSASSSGCGRRRVGAEAKSKRKSDTA
ncbi:uncharacterized protein RAG0_02534 [Rhynchosporium agropyri]|uniref:Uncharacterized protein n=1 Tax=Rhynchosporium agropyri TaxID=914238 RepID=A0A1E1K1J7_9HELO|nr:uncharacterized protein RAG0_02534 [Rhynchosporium agropyri]